MGATPGGGGGPSGPGASLACSAPAGRAARCWQRSRSGCGRRRRCAAVCVSALLGLARLPLAAAVTEYTLSVTAQGEYTLTGPAGTVFTVTPPPGEGGSRASVGIVPETIPYESAEATQLRTSYSGSRPVYMWYWQVPSVVTPGFEPLRDTIGERPDSLVRITWTEGQRTAVAYYLDWASYTPVVQYMVLAGSGASRRLLLCRESMAHVRWTHDAAGGVAEVDCCVGDCSRATAPDRIARFGNIERGQVWSAGTVRITLRDEVLDSAAINAFFAIGLDRLRAWHNMQYTAVAIRDHNDERKEQARATTAVLFTFVAIGMLLQSVIFGVVFGWLVQPLPVPAGLLATLSSGIDGEQAKVKWNTFVSVAVWIIINFLVSGLGGFTGWWVMGCLYFIVSVSCGCVGCVRRLQTRNCCLEGASCMGLQQVSPGKEAPASAPTQPQEGEEMGPKDAAGEPAAAAPKDLKFPEGACFGCCCSHPQRWRPFSGAGETPGQMGRSQECCLWVNTALICLIFFIILIVVYAWQIKDYKIIRRYKGDEEIEIIPDLTAKAVQFMYAWDGVATDLKLQLYTKWLTQWCGRTMKESLSDSEKDVKIRDDFITKYAINMTDYRPTDYRAYDSVNQWFIRHLAEGVRPIAGERLAPTVGGWAAATPRQRDASPHSNVVVSPADCRMLIYPSLQAARVWVKGSRFNYYELIGERSQYRHTFERGAMVIARLAPQDYHRFNSPIGGVVREQYDVDGTYWSVNADAARSENYAFYNLRRVVLIEYISRDGSPKIMAYVAIGATCVGSVIFTGPDGSGVRRGTALSKGDELGFMQFGGSTVIMLFEEGELVPDEDIASNSELPVETYIRVKERLGMFRDS
eukprot:TRINITY_DN60462_c0_g1_i1.p1 TRINITY_DN60462_c0_g1~~TRINITY_DN60462_c0_g1_i1.p1  ORF type:complete len:900 (+),score=235.35 TRINITY_DN60462_c0_g1_i1:115-2700(+)